MSKGDGLRQQRQQPPPLEEDNLAMAMDTQVEDQAAAPALTLKRQSSTTAEAHRTDTPMAVAPVQTQLQTRRQPSSIIKEAMKSMITVMVGEQIPTPKPLESLSSITTTKEVMIMAMITEVDQIVPADHQELLSPIEVEVEKSMIMAMEEVQAVRQEEAQGL